jgi:acetyltransferase-like isoleucine patch superfamily enzyme
MIKFAVKWILRGASLMAAFPAAAASAFGAWETGYVMFAHACSLMPGIPGDYLRIAFYKLTLTECDLSSRVSFGSFFAHSQVRLGAGVYIGPYCVLGKTVIGDHTQIAAGVQILSGSRQHARNEAGEISGAEGGEFAVVEIGANCWIGAAAIVMADVGAGSTIGAGSVVTRPIPAGSVAVGSPARVLPRA